MDNSEVPYLLAQHVHVCVCGRHAVLMDLRRNKYLAVEPPYLLADWVRGWPAASAQASAPCGTAGPGSGAGAARARSLLSQMLSGGMLVRDGQEGRTGAPPVISAAQRTLLEFDFDERPATGAAALGRFTLAWARARSALALRSMYAIVRAIQASKARRGAGAGVPDPERERVLVRAFVHLRPLFYTVRRACLLDSLTLLHFLSGYGVYPQWVFGVRTAPFDAHCWIQRREVLFNDLPDRVRQYTPILMV